jgi:hypothetical protein
MKIRLLLFLCLTSFFSACLKPATSKIRVSNFFTERLVLVAVGIDEVEFKDVEKQTQTEYKDLGFGSYSVFVETLSGKRFETVIRPEKYKKGKFTILLDGIGRLSVQDDLK